jgi:hypothetical protein
LALRVTDTSIVSVAVAARRVELTAVLIWFVGILLTHSDAGVSYPVWMFLVLGFIVLTGWWVIRIAGARSMRPAPSPWVPVLLALGVVLAFTSWLLTARVFLSAQALIRSGPVLTATPELTLHSKGQWVGLFRVRQFAQFEHELRFITNECGLVDTCGIVFSPDGVPPRRGEDSFVHLYGSWWHWYQSW